MTLSNTEKMILNNQITTFRNSLISKKDLNIAVVWSAETYLHNKISDFSPEEVAAAKETTNDLERLVQESYKKYKKAEKSWNRCYDVVSGGSIIETIWQEAFDDMTEFFNFSNELGKKCEDIRQQMLKNIRDSGVDP